MSEKRKERCETCRFWEIFDEHDTTSDGVPMDGYCHRSPPQLATHSKAAKELASIHGCGGMRRGVFPLVMFSEWCGEWQAVAITEQPTSPPVPPPLYPPPVRKR
jgi:hypothetical protein